MYFPKWGVARGKDEIARCFGDVGQLFTSILHHPEYLKMVVQGDVVVAEGITKLSWPFSTNCMISVTVRRLKFLWENLGEPRLPICVQQL